MRRRRMIDNTITSAPQFSCVVVVRDRVGAGTEREYPTWLSLVRTVGADFEERVAEVVG
jgi:hypothetical protein